MSPEASGSNFSPPRESVTATATCGATVWQCYLAPFLLQSNVYNVQFTTCKEPVQGRQAHSRGCATITTCRDSRHFVQLKLRPHSTLTPRLSPSPRPHHPTSCL